MTGCQYRVWRNGALEPCGEDGSLFTQPKLMMKLPEFVKKTTILCQEHRVFVIDCIDRSEIEIEKLNIKREKMQKKLKFPHTKTSH